MTKGGGEGNMAGTAASLGAGLAMGQQMAAALGASQTLRRRADRRGRGVPPVIGGAGAMPELLGTAEVAKALGVSEADVMATRLRKAISREENQQHVAGDAGGVGCGVFEVASKLKPHEREY